MPNKFNLLANILLVDISKKLSSLYDCNFESELAAAAANAVWKNVNFSCITL